MMDFKILFISILLLLSVGIATAADYTNIIPPSDNVYINTSYKLADSSYTPFAIFIFIAAAGLYLMLFSFLATMEQNADVFAYLAVPLIGLATWQSTGLDVITGSGTASQAGNYILLENHTIYSIPGVTIILLILFVISILNIYRLVVMNRPEEEYTDSVY